jgi:hypothetical protein
MPRLDPAARASRARELAQQARQLTDADLDALLVQAREHVDQLRRQLEEALLWTDALDGEHDRRSIHRRVLAGE